MIPENIREEIMRRLADVEKSHNVKIIYAVESGSRAWGFPSPDSDYDVRFIYIHPKEWYLSIDVEDKRDVIEQPITDYIDLNGWDIRKALKLLRQSNPGIVEWLQSPIVYLNESDFVSNLREILPTIYSPLKGIHHYRGMAKRNIAEHLSKESVNVKKYFYVLRAILACKYILSQNIYPPIEFDQLLVETVVSTDPVITEIKQLLADKRKGFERKTGLRNEIIDKFIKDSIDNVDVALTTWSSDSKRVDHVDLNVIFRTYIG